MPKFPLPRGGPDAHSLTDTAPAYVSTESRPIKISQEDLDSIKIDGSSELPNVGRPRFAPSDQEIEAIASGKAPLATSEFDGLYEGKTNAAAPAAVDEFAGAYEGNPLTSSQQELDAMRIDGKPVQGGVEKNVFTEAQKALSIIDKAYKISEQERVNARGWNRALMGEITVDEAKHLYSSDKLQRVRIREMTDYDAEPLDVTHILTALPKSIASFLPHLFKIQPGIFLVGALVPYFIVSLPFALGTIVQATSNRSFSQLMKISRSIKAGKTCYRKALLVSFVIIIFLPLIVGSLPVTYPILLFLLMSILSFTSFHLIAQAFDNYRDGE